MRWWRGRCRRSRRWRSTRQPPIPRLNSASDEAISRFSAEQQELPVRRFRQVGACILRAHDQAAKARQPNAVARREREWHRICAVPLPMVEAFNLRASGMVRCFAGYACATNALKSSLKSALVVSTKTPLLPPTQTEYFPPEKAHPWAG